MPHIIREVEVRIGRFKSDLGELGPQRCVQRHIIFGSSHVLTDDQHFSLKEATANHFEINPMEVIVVGSAKLGFSIAERKRYRPFGDTSDIDVAIINARLFDQIWEDVFDYWCRARDWPDENGFKKNLFRGWIRPDMLPSSSSFQRAERWWRFFNELSASRKFGPYKIRAGLYRTAKFLERYQCICAEQCLSELSVGMEPIVTCAAHEEGRL